MDKYFVMFRRYESPYPCQSSSSVVARLHILAMIFVKISFSSMVIPSSFTSPLHFICLFSIANVILLLSVFDTRNIIWNLPGLATMLSTLTLSWQRLWSYRNQSVDLLRKSMDQFLHDNDFRHERVKPVQNKMWIIK